MGALSVSGAWTKHCPRTRRTKHCSGERSGTQTYLAHVAFRQELIDEPLAHAIPHRVELLTHRSRVVVILQEHKGEVMLVHAGHSWASTLRSCCTMLPYVSVNTSALILSIFWNACSPIRVKFLLPPAIGALFFVFGVF